MKTENISIEFDGDQIFVTVSKYKLFLSRGKIGMDAYLLYSHYIFTARLQKTQSVWANNTYVREGLHWGKERLLKAKKLLKELQLIEIVQKKDDKGKFSKSYIKVKTKTTPFEVETPDLPGGLKSGGLKLGLPERDRKCFNKEVKCFNEKANATQQQKNINNEKPSYVLKLNDKDITEIHKNEFFSINKEFHEMHHECYNYTRDQLIKEYDKMRGWLHGHPDRAKQAVKGYKRFVTNWLAKTNPAKKDFEYEEFPDDYIAGEGWGK